MRRFRSFLVRLPSGDRYWTVVGAGYRPVAEADEWLLHVRLGQDRAENTTEAYARSLALFFEWCAAIGQDWRTSPGEFGRFARSGEGALVVAARGGQLPGEDVAAQHGEARAAADGGTGAVPGVADECCHPAP